MQHGLVAVLHIFKGTNFIRYFFRYKNISLPNVRIYEAFQKKFYIKFTFKYSLSLKLNQQIDFSF